jgi:hypothetical protein
MVQVEKSKCENKLHGNTKSQRELLISHYGVSKNTLTSVIREGNNGLFQPHPVRQKRAPEMCDVRCFFLWGVVFEEYFHGTESLEWAIEVINEALTPTSWRLSFDEEEKDMDVSSFPDVVYYLQQDNAGGHSIARGMSEVMMELKAWMRQHGIKMFEQPPNSPETETNIWDLGMWRSLQAGAIGEMQVSAQMVHNSEHNDSFVHRAIHKAVCKFVEEIDPKTLWNINVQRTVVLLQIKKNKGKEMGKEPHTGVRKFWGTHHT